MKKQSMWPISISIFLACFFALVVFGAIRISQQRYDLVAPDYYEKEIAYEAQIDAKRRAGELVDGPAFSVDGNHFVIQVPPALAGGIERARLHLYYPADKKMDLQADIDFSQGSVVRIPLEGRSGANWRVQLDWRQAGVDYSVEKRMGLSP